MEVVAGFQVQVIENVVSRISTGIDWNSAGGVSSFQRPKSVWKRENELGRNHIVLDHCFLKVFGAEVSRPRKLRTHSPRFWAVNIILFWWSGFQRLCGGYSSLSKITKCPGIFELFPNSISYENHTRNTNFLSRQSKLQMWQMFSDQWPRTLSLLLK